MDSISKRARYRFREHLVGWSLRTITDLFESADISRGIVPPERMPGGERRSLVEEYYAGVDWASPRDVRKVLSVYEQILDGVSDDPTALEPLVSALQRDGFVHEAGHLRSLNSADLQRVRDASVLVDRAVLTEHLRRIEQGVESDPAQAIGSAKELIETVAKLVLEHFGEDPEQYDSIQQLVKRAVQCLNPGLENVPKASKGAEAIRQVVAGLAQIVGGVAALRNLYGTGHGRPVSVRLEPRHAQLVVGSCSTLVIYLLETLDARKRSATAENAQVVT
jgi:hypothetical protein